jgi:hypothetical protein
MSLVTEARKGQKLFVPTVPAGRIFSEPRGTDMGICFRGLAIICKVPARTSLLTSSHLASLISLRAKHAHPGCAMFL